MATKEVVIEIYYNWFFSVSEIPVSVSGTGRKETQRFANSI
jgi:hypothetical protein